MSVDPELLAILVCPACRVAVRPAPDSGVACDACGRVYPVRDGIPVMRVEESSAPRRQGRE